jgi:hypothetical protein
MKVRDLIKTEDTVSTNMGSMPVVVGAKQKRRRKRDQSCRDNVAEATVSELLQKLMEASGHASKQQVEIIAQEMAEAPAVRRRLGKLFDGEVDVAGLVAALTPVITKWLEKHDIKVAGSSQAQKAIRQMAKE